VLSCVIGEVTREFRRCCRVRTRGKEKAVHSRLIQPRPVDIRGIQRVEVSY